MTDNATLQSCLKCHNLPTSQGHPPSSCQANDPNIIPFAAKLEYIRGNILLTSVSWKSKILQGVYKKGSFNPLSQTIVKDPFL